MKVFELLEIIKRDGPKSTKFGVCSEVERLINIHQLDMRVCVLHQSYKDWSKFSGYDTYPIPSPKGGTPWKAFNLTNDSDMWNPSHPYGKLRLEFLDFLIDWFKSRDK